MSSRHLVTAAHCVYRTSEADWEVVLGEHHPHSVDPGEQVVKVRSPDYIWGDKMSKNKNKRTNLYKKVSVFTMLDGLYFL